MGYLSGWQAICAAVLATALGCGDSEGETSSENGPSGSGSGAGGDSSGAGASGSASGGSASGGAGGQGANGAAGPGGAGAAGGSGGSGAGGGDDDEPDVMLTFSGSCTPLFDGTLSVATNNESIAVYSQNDDFDSSIQLALQGATGLQALSTQHRIDTGIVINVIDDNVTWTNIATTQPDPITGTMTIVSNQQNDGIVRVEFSGATLVRPGMEASTCTISGSLETYGTYFQAD